VPPRARLYLNVALAALVAAAVVVGLTLDTRTDPVQPQPFPGKPSVPSAVPGPAGVQIEQAFRDWPKGSIDTMQRLGLTYPKNALVQYYRGVALLWAGYPSDAESALELAKRLGRNTLVGEKADNILHPNYFAPSSPPYYPVFKPTEPNKLLEEGSLLQEQGHNVSAEAVFSQAVKRDPTDPQAQVAAAVALFDEDNLVPVFGRLGTLTGRYPTSQAVHYYLGYILSWTDQKAAAVTQYEETVKLDPKTTLGQASTAWLEALAKAAAAAK
jgi:tetratricopeptide (TPR) repeat protein